MLKAMIDAEIFRESIDAIVALVTECRLHTADDHIWTRAVDTANVADPLTSRAAFNFILGTPERWAWTSQR